MAEATLHDACPCVSRLPSHSVTAASPLPFRRKIFANTSHAAVPVSRKSAVAKIGSGNGRVRVEERGGLHPGYAAAPRGNRELFFSPCGV